MNRMLTILVCLTLLCSPAFGGDFKKMSLDDAAILGTTIQTDLKIKTEGLGSIRITTLSPTTVCLGEVDSPDVENARLVYSAKVRTDLEGAAYLEMWAHLGTGQYFSRGMNDTVEGKSGWQSIRTPFIFRKGQRPEKIILNLVINGRGTAWIDDVVLSKEPLK